MRWILLFAAALVLTSIFEPPLMAAFDDWGWHKAPENIASDVVNWLENIVGVAAFPWVSGGFLGSAIGAWAHFFASRKDNQKPSKDSMFAMLHFDINDLLRKFWVGQERHGETDLKWINQQTKLNLNALYAQLKRIGIRPPEFDSTDPLLFNIGNYSYLQALEPLARSGLFAEAKTEGKRVREEVIAGFLSHQPKSGTEEKTLR